MNAQHTPGPKRHPTETAEYWLDLARSERAFARDDQGRSRGTVESMRIHLCNAEDYEATAARIVAAETAT